LLRRDSLGGAPDYLDNLFLAMKGPFAHTSGPRDAKIVIVGEAWGETEDLVGLPFQGHSGQELTKLLQEAGIERRHCLLTNVLALRPPGNDVLKLCARKSDLGGASYLLPPLGQGACLRPEFFPELERLGEELLASPRHLVIALGNTATWAILGRAAISKIRGTVATATHCGRGLKVLPTFHPAMVLRNWGQRPIVVQDLMKAKRESEFPEVRRPERQVLINPSLRDLFVWGEAPIPLASVDIETARGQISMIGIARSRSDAVVVPFFNNKLESYWDTAEEEVLAWRFVKGILENPHIPKLFQNGLYDLQYILRLGISPRNVTEDTMLLHHALYPEMLKGLGFLGSIYTNESSWKLMRDKESLKRDE
jgi:uracil-DNA glycosylase